MRTFSEIFLADTTEVLAKIGVDDIERVVATLEATRARGGRLFLAGSGGGAGHAPTRQTKSKQRNTFVDL